MGGSFPCYFKTRNSDLRAILEMCGIGESKYLLVVMGLTLYKLLPLGP